MTHLLIIRSINTILFEIPYYLSRDQSTHHQKFHHPKHLMQRKPPLWNSTSQNIVVSAHLEPTYNWSLSFCFNLLATLCCSNLVQINTLFIHTHTHTHACTHVILQQCHKLIQTITIVLKTRHLQMAGYTILIKKSPKSQNLVCITHSL